MSKTHTFNQKVIWTGNNGSGTSEYTAYGRDHILQIDGKPEIACSADPAFRGDGAKPNPEDLFIYALSSCHMLWYLHLCADAGLIVTAYEDHASGVLTLGGDGPSKMTDVLLKPIVTVNDENMVQKAIELHEEANAKCFMANSVNFKVRHEVTVKVHA